MHRQDTLEKNMENTHQHNIFCNESQVMVQRSNVLLLYGHIYQIVTEDILGENMSRYLLNKNKGWDRDIIQMIGWKAMESYMKKLPESRIKNVVKLSPIWQNNGQYKHSFTG